MNTRKKITLQQLGAATKRTAERERSEFNYLQAETNKEDLVDQRKFQEERKFASKMMTVTNQSWMTQLTLSEEDVDVEETVVNTRLKLLLTIKTSSPTFSLKSFICFFIKFLKCLDL
ncbi:hypothetical protein BpHYR1_015272 [Brachionus plicatilis]|uniref:Uncharacterized protein n=1 Tax=Brachionus plicatilis TaxID=10195 RepID=A0A3M7RNW6_BRAPC|nr:hypothetical protein BpHYR1_015272 [Brachionus plicatilis]